MIYLLSMLKILMSKEIYPQVRECQEKYQQTQDFNEANGKGQRERLAEGNVKKQRRVLPHKILEKPNDKGNHVLQRDKAKN